MDSFWRDLQYGLRMLARNPGVTAVAVLTLAFGIGANTAIFSVVDAIQLRPLPVAQPDQLVRVYTSYVRASGEALRGNSSHPDYRDIREQSQLLADLAWYYRRGAVLRAGDEAIMIAGNSVSGNYFAALGVKAAAGRVFTEADVEAPGAAPLVVISHGLWQRRFAADRQIIGRTISLSNQFHTVVGVAPKEFRGLDLHLAPDVWIPDASLPRQRASFNDRSNRNVELFGRLRPGVTLEQAQAELNSIAQHLAETYPATNAGRKLTVRKESETRNLAAFSALLLAISLLVLLISCANVANLLLARAEARRREIAVRFALGAGRARLVRQLLTESLLLALLGAGLASLFAFWVIGLLPSLFPPMAIPLSFDFRLDARVFAFTMGISLLAVFLFGLAPALRATRVGLVDDLKETAAAAGSTRQQITVRNVLVVGQLALSLMLLAGAGLLVRSLWKLSEFDPGFNTRQNMLLVDLSTGVAGHSETRARAFYGEIRERVAALPGVAQVTLTRRVPLSGSGGGATKSLLIPGHDVPAGEPGIPINYTIVAHDYFRVMGTRILRGRSFTERDDNSAQQVAVINEAMARRYWPNDDPIGRHFRIVGAKTADCEVVGVAQDGKYVWLTDEPRPYLFLSLAQQMSFDLTLVVQTARDPRALADAVRATIRAVDKDVPILNMITLDDHMRFSLYFQRLTTSLFGWLGLLGLLLASVGLYGVISYVVNRRTHEIGVRMALGAQPRDIARLIVGQGMRVAALGVALGLAGAFGMTRLLGGLLFGVSPADPLTYAAVAGVLGAVALIASYLPARRAARVNPVVALRYE